jgi:hypothetical protein
MRQIEITHQNTLEEPRSREEAARGLRALEDQSPEASAPAATGTFSLAAPRVDVHRHLWPDEFVAALAARTTAPYLRGGTLVTTEGRFAIDLAAHGLERCLEDLDRAGLDVALVSLQPTLGISRLPEDEAAGLSGAYEQGVSRFVARAQGRVRAFAAGEVKEGFVGVCVAAEALLDLEALAPLAGELARRSQTLFVHPGPAAPPAHAPSWWGATVDYTAQMQAAYASWLAGGATLWPRLRVIFAILAGGAPFQLERLSSRGVDPRCLDAPNVLFDTASYGRLALEFCLAAFGVDRLVYGSDAPVIDARPTLNAVNALGDATADAILRRNPAAILTV